MSDRQEGWARRCTPPSDLVMPVRIDPKGETGPTPGQARGPGWRQSSYGLYVPSHVDASVVEQRIIEEGARLSGGGAVTGWAAGRAFGAGYLDGFAPDGRTELPVPMTTGAVLRLAETRGCVLRRERIYDDEIVHRLGVPCAFPPRAVFDGMRYAPHLRAAVVVMDMFATAGIVSIAQAGAYVAAHPAWEGVQRARDALGLADERSWSPKETDMRLVWELDAGLRRPLCNWPVFTVDGRFVGRPDLLDPEASAGLTCSTQRRVWSGSMTAPCTCPAPGGPRTSAARTRSGISGWSTSPSPEETSPIAAGSLSGCWPRALEPSGCPSRNGGGPRSSRPGGATPRTG